MAPASPARGPKAARDADFQMAVTQAHKRYRSDRSGTLPESLPTANQVSPDLYGVVIVRISGKIFEAGDTRVPLMLADVAAPFTAALLAEQQGGAGANNPLDREGSIATLSLVKPRHDADGKWRVLLGNFGAFAGRELVLDESLYRSASAATPQIEEAVRRLAEQGRLQDDASATADLYLRQGAVTLTARDLAIMAATLANGGTNPVNGRPVVKSDVSKELQAAIANSGLMKLGMPAVAGKSGAIIAVVPGRFGLAVYSPPLDAAGNSVRGQRAIKYLSQALQTNLPQY
jgi:glutaminase